MVHSVQFFKTIATLWLATTDNAVHTHRRPVQFFRHFQPLIIHRFYQFSQFLVCDCV